MEETIESIQNQIIKLHIEAHEIIMNRSTELRIEENIELVLSPFEVKALNIINKKAEELFLKKEEIHKRVEDKIEFNKDLLKQQKRVLTILLEYPNGLSGQEISTKLSLYRARVYESLVALRLAGLVFSKEINQSHRRKYYIITPLGIRTMNNIEPK